MIHVQVSFKTSWGIQLQSTFCCKLLGTKRLKTVSQNTSRRCLRKEPKTMNESVSENFARLRRATVSSISGFNDDEKVRETQRRHSASQEPERIIEDDHQLSPKKDTRRDRRNSSILAFGETNQSKSGGNFRHRSSYVPGVNRTQNSTKRFNDKTVLINDQPNGAEPEKSSSNHSDGVGKWIKSKLWNGLHSRFWKPLIETATGIGIRDAPPYREPTRIVHAETMSQYGLKVKINKADKLEHSICSSKRMVRVCIVDATSGVYIKKSPKTFPPENNSDTHTYPTDAGHDHKTSPTSIVLPMTTGPGSSIRIESEYSVSSWNDQPPLLFDICADQIVNSNAVILFEVLEYGTSASGNAEKYEGALYPLAWGFMKPVSHNGSMNIEQKPDLGSSIKLQLFRYPVKNWSYYFLSEYLGRGKSPGVIPSVYTAFRMKQRKPCPSTLDIRVSVCKLAKPQQQNGNTIIESKVLQSTCEEETKQKQDDGLQKKAGTKDYSKSKFAGRTRSKNQPCIIPGHLLCRLPSGTMGSLDVKFSTDGKYLAVACTYENNFPIEIYDTETMTRRFTLAGHHSIVYELSWSSGEKADLKGFMSLASSSADGTVRLWAIPCTKSAPSAASLEANHTSHASATEFKGDQGHTKAKCIHVLQHGLSNHVYTAQFHPTADKPFIIATGAHDGYIRLWNCDTGQFSVSDEQSSNIPPPMNIGQRHHKTNVNCVKFTSNGTKLVSGDGNGKIIIWQLDQDKDPKKPSAWRIARTIEDNGYLGKSITSIQIHQNNKMVLICAQHCSIKLFDISLKNPVYKWISSSMSSALSLKALFSPDGRYIVSGNEDGRPYFWDTNQSTLLGSTWRIGYPEPLRSVSWHPSADMIAYCSFGGQYPALIYYVPKGFENNISISYDQSIGNEENRGPAAIWYASNLEAKPKVDINNSKTQNAKASDLWKAIGVRLQNIKKMRATLLEDELDDSEATRQIKSFTSK